MYGCVWVDDEAPCCNMLHPMGETFTKTDSIHLSNQRGAIDSESRLLRKIRSTVRKVYLTLNREQQNSLKRSESCQQDWYFVFWLYHECSECLLPFEPWYWEDMKHLPLSCYKCHSQHFVQNYVELFSIWKMNFSSACLI